MTTAAPDGGYYEHNEQVSFQLMSNVNTMNTSAPDGGYYEHNEQVSFQLMSNVNTMNTSAPDGGYYEHNEQVSFQLMSNVNTMNKWSLRETARLHEAVRGCWGYVRLWGVREAVGGT